MILVVQFRGDQSGPHELEILHGAGGVPFHRYRAINAVAEETTADELLELPKRAKGIVIGGWGENGYEAKDEAGKELLQGVAQKMRPMVEYVVEEDVATLGMCFGHQLLADIAGGTVTVDSKLAEAGVAEITLTEAGQVDPLFGDLGKTFAAVVGHKATVTELPDGAVCLAKSAKAPIQAFRLGRNVYGAQFHPEMDVAGLKHRLAMYPDYSPHLLEFDEDTKIEADKIASRFVEMADQSTR